MTVAPAGSSEDLVDELLVWRLHVFLPPDRYHGENVPCRQSGVNNGLAARASRFVPFDSPPSFRLPIWHDSGQLIGKRTNDGKYGGAPGRRKAQEESIRLPFVVAEEGKFSGDLPNQAIQLACTAVHPLEVESAIVAFRPRQTGTTQADLFTQAIQTEPAQFPDVPQFIHAALSCLGGKIARAKTAGDPWLQRCQNGKFYGAYRSAFRAASASRAASSPSGMRCSAR